MINAIEKYNQYKKYIGLVNAFVSTLPSSNLKDGDIYILNSDNSVNIYYNSSWKKVTATTGMLCVLKTDSNIYVFSNGSWESKSTDINQEYLDTELAKKVDKIDGYSLVSDNDILNWNSKADGEHTHVMEDITDFPTIPIVTNDLTNELKNNYDTAYENTHAHINKSKIDKIDEDVNGNLTYNGNTIVANSTWDNISDKPFETLDSDTLKVTDGVLSAVGGGSGGTTNYSNLENKPSINSVELNGNKTSADLGLSPTEHEHTVSDITDFPISMPASDVYAWAKSTTKPTYTASEIGALPNTTTIPTKTSDLTNDSGFITSLESGDMFKSVYDTNNNGIVDNAERVNNHTVESDVPSNAVFTDTIYTHPSTHPATMIIEDSTHRFVTDNEKTAWNDGLSSMVSPIATVSKVDTTATITITDINGTTTATVYDGENGADGKDGLNGANGQDGTNGTDGLDGKSAYQSALDGGFVGTESAFNASLASIGDISAVLDSINGEVV